MLIASVSRNSRNSTDFTGKYHGIFLMPITSVEIGQLLKVSWNYKKFIITEVEREEREKSNVTKSNKIQFDATFSFFGRVCMRSIIGLCASIRQ